MLQLSGETIILREFTEDNLKDPRYFQWLRDLDVVTPIYRLEYLMPMQFQEVENYVNTLMTSKNDCFFAIFNKDKDEFIGTLRIGHIDWRAGVGDVGVLIGEKKYWGKGIAKQAVEIACNYAFNTLGLRKLTGGSPKSNVAMCKCFDSLGFKQEGKLEKQLLIGGEYIDHMLYGYLKDNYIKDHKKQK